jgi:hypothetical protein
VQGQAALIDEGVPLPYFRMVSPGTTTVPQFVIAGAGPHARIGPDGHLVVETGPLALHSLTMNEPAGTWIASEGTLMLTSAAAGGFRDDSGWKITGTFDATFEDSSGVAAPVEVHATF